jgi:hypothetical protein
MYLGGPISWRTKLQDTVAQSSTEAEYMAMTDAVNLLTYLRGVLDTLEPVTYPVRLLEDNQGAIALSANRLTHRRTRHIDIRYHVIRDHVKLGLVKVVFTGTKDMLADGMTKILGRPTHTLTFSKVMKTGEQTKDGRVTP